MFFLCERYVWPPKVTLMLPRKYYAISTDKINTIRNPYNLVFQICVLCYVESQHSIWQYTRNWDGQKWYWWYDMFLWGQQMLYWGIRMLEHLKTWPQGRQHASRSTANQLKSWTTAFDSMSGRAVRDVQIGPSSRIRHFQRMWSVSGVSIV